MNNLACKPFVLGLILLTGFVSPQRGWGDDWMTWRSTYTHDPVYGQRVDQYARPADPVSPRRPDFQRSGYRNYRSTLQTGNSADNLHIVEQWGAPVVPYEQWRFPYRPFGVPYDAWGPPTPYGIFNGYQGWAPGTIQPYPIQPPSGQWAPSPLNGSTNGFRGPGDAGPGMPPGGYPGYRYPGPNVAAPYNGFPLTPPYRNEPWYDGTYPDAAPLGGQGGR